MNASNRKLKICLVDSERKESAEEYRALGIHRTVLDASFAARGLSAFEISVERVTLFHLWVYSLSPSGA